MSQWNEEPVGRGRHGSNTLLWVVILGSLTLVLCVTSVAVAAGAALFIFSGARGGESSPVDLAPIPPTMVRPDGGGPTDPSMIPTVPPPADMQFTPTPVPADMGATATPFEMQFTPTPVPQ